ncbi:MAG TPA: 4'-phosphopantetheinyl transferase superfamily protein [Solirubrobacteraceae bacterium]|nr:4'-phosphopantetheinyl transferase superfamily protein [Solirubrobacteraceae bacterium]
MTDESRAAYTARSYRFPWALVAWHHAPVGVDLERLGSVDRPFAESIATPAERVELAGRPDPDSWVADLWCSKEALAKALGDAVLYDPRRLDAPIRWPDLRSGRWHAARVDSPPPGHVGWVCWR